MRTALLVGGVVVAAACAGGPGPGDVGYGYDVDGRYTGRLIVEGEPFEAELELHAESDGRVSGSFAVSAPVEVEGRVTGRIVDDLLRMTMTYEDSGTGACSSGVEGILSVSRGGEVIEGPVTITDCGQALPGRLSFRRTPVRP